MNKPKHSLHLVACATLALCSAAAHAAPTQAELDSIVLYGSTTIAKDSTSAWGVWEQIDPPAAGPQLPRLDNVAKADLYRPLPQVIQTASFEPVCASGGICGFGAFYDFRSYGGEVALAVSTTATKINATGEHPYVLTASPVELPVIEIPAPPVAPIPVPPVVLEQTAAATGTVNLPAAVEILGKALSTGTLLIPNSGTLVFDGYNGYRTGFGTEGSPYYEIYANSRNNDYFDPAAVGATWYYGYVERYVAGEGEARGQWQSQEFYGVAGYTTTAADMSALRASNATATYAGYDAKGYTETPNVVLNVDFGKGTFTGSFNGGADGNIGVGTSTSGSVLRGAVGFNVSSGLISGSEFKSTGLSASDGAVSGTVRGAFFGSMAAAAGGVADVTKTRTDGTYTNARFVSPFLAIKGQSMGTVRDRFKD